MKRVYFAVVAMCATLGARVGAQTAQNPARTETAAAPALEHFRFRAYLADVGRGNLDLVAQRASVSVAVAQIAIARVFPDPQVTAGVLQYDVTGKGNPTETLVTLGVPLEIGGQRGARIAVAEANLSATRADVLEFVRGLLAEGATDYVEALHARYVLDRQRRTLASLERLVTVNQERFKAGDIGEAEVIQSRVEANQFRAAVLDSEGEVRAADIALVALLGTGASARLGREVELDGDLRHAADRHFSVDALVKTALANRPDLLAARRRVTAANRQIELARANRVIGVTLGATWQHNFEVGSAPPLPAADLIGGTITVPIPFSRLYRGELDAAYAGQDQARALARGTSVRVEAEVRQAITHYEAAAARVRLYTKGVLADADAVLEKTLYNYQRGGATLVEVLVAQHTDNDVYLSYYDSLADAARALIAVEQASGTWDIDF
ncbi:MAG TPA: TolC family protein [Polyangiaceae bacterium]|nr:TolC family protein [Polyangiaceae bacterium]